MGADVSDQLTRRSTDEGWRSAFVGSLDIVAWAVAMIVGYSFYGRNALEEPQVTLILMAAIAHLAFGVATGLYRGRFPQYSFEEAGAVAISAGAAGATTVVAEFVIWNEGRSGQIIVMSTSIAVILMLGHRYLRRIRAKRVARAAQLDRIPVIVYGAGEGGGLAVKAMQSLGSDYRPVALLDDDPAKRRLRIGGVRVEGGIDDLNAIARRHGARCVLLAMPAASARELRDMHERINLAGLDTLVMPPVQRLTGSVSPRELTAYSDEVLIDRQIDDLDGIDGRRPSPPAPGVRRNGSLRQHSRPGTYGGAPRGRSSSARSASTAARPLVPAAAVLDDTLDLERLEEVFAHQTALPTARRVLVVGAGGHARVCLEALLADDDTLVVGAVSHDGSGLEELGIPVLGLDVGLQTVAERRDANTFCIAIGDNAIRHRLGRMLIDAGHDLATAISASATVSPSARLGAGVQILPAAVVNAAARIGEGTIINTNASVDHDCRIGDYVHIAPGVALGGNVIVGDGTLVGIGARVLPGVRIGANSIVGAGAVVIDDVPDGTTVVGVPARRIERTARRA